MGAVRDRRYIGLQRVTWEYKGLHGNTGETLIAIQGENTREYMGEHGYKGVHREAWEYRGIHGKRGRCTTIGVMRI